MNRVKLYLVILLCINLSCVSAGSLSFKEIRNIPAKKIESHSVNLDKQFKDRIACPPQVILQYLREMDSTDKYEQYFVSDAEKELLAEYFRLLPDFYSDILEKKVVAIYPVKNFTGGGMADYLFDEKGEMYVVLYFNPEIFHMSLKEWIRYRDNSAFADDGSGVSIEADVNGGFKGLLHTLVHEASHIYDYYYHVTPYVEPELMSYNRGQGITEFTAGIWKDHSVPLEKYDFKGRNSLYPYGFGRPVNISESVELYRSLNQGPFSSLFGSKNWSEDFAELFTWYYLHKKLKINYTVKIIKNGETIIKYTPLNNECIGKRYIYLDRL